MKFIKRKAECVSITYHNGERIPDWRCPSCGMGIADDYICCPYCGQKVEFDKSNIKSEEFTVSLNHKVKSWKNSI